MRINRRKDDEHTEQAIFDKWFQLQYPSIYDVVYAVANGGKRHISVALKLKKEGVKPGIPDYCIPVGNNKHNALYIEFKVGNNKPSAIQRYRIERLRDYNNRVEICYSMEEAKKIAKEHLRGLE